MSAPTDVVSLADYLPPTAEERLAAIAQLALSGFDGGPGAALEVMTAIAAALSDLRFPEVEP